MAVHCCIHCGVVWHQERLYIADTWEWTWRFKYWCGEDQRIRFAPQGETFIGRLRRRLAPDQPTRRYGFWTFSKY